MSYTTCSKCGWVHFEVSKAYVQQWKDEWTEWCKTWPEEHLEAYGIVGRQPPSDESYYRCFRCGNPHTHFQDYKEGDCPKGCTIQPILSRHE